MPAIASALPQPVAAPSADQAAAASPAPGASFKDHLSSAIHGGSPTAPPGNLPGSAASPATAGVDQAPRQGTAQAQAAAAQAPGPQKGTADGQTTAQAAPSADSSATVNTDPKQQNPAFGSPAIPVLTGTAVPGVLPNVPAAATAKETGAAASSPALTPAARAAKRGTAAAPASASGTPADPAAAAPGPATLLPAMPMTTAAAAAAQPQPASTGQPAGNTAAADQRFAPAVGHRVTPGAGLMPAGAAPDGGSAATTTDAKPGLAFPDPSASQPAPAAAADTSAQIDLSALAAPAAASAPAAVVQSQIKVTPAHGDVGGSTAPSPAAQVTPALASITQASDGSSRLTLRLDPAELGHVQIRIDRPQDAPARIEITADRPETLALLQRDQPQLQRALDQAGVPADRSLTFHAGGTGTASGGAGGQGAFGAGTSGHSGGGSQGWAGRPQPRYAVDDQDYSAQQPYAPSRWMRAGLDITA